MVTVRTADKATKKRTAGNKAVQLKPSIKKTQPTTSKNKQKRKVSFAEPHARNRAKDLKEYELGELMDVFERHIHYELWYEWYCTNKGRNACFKKRSYVKTFGTVLQHLEDFMINYCEAVDENSGNRLCS